MAEQHDIQRLAGRRVAITGAGSGLGRALALRFARAGWRVAVSDIQPDRAQRVADEVADAGGKAVVGTLDVRKPVDFATLNTRLAEEWGGLDVFVNNAGVAGAGTVADIPLEDWQWLLDINLMGTVRGARAALPLLRASQGHLVNVASFAAIANAPGMAAYNVAKAGILSLSESIRAEEYDHRVGVTVVCPTFFASNLLESFRGTDSGQEVVAQKLMERARMTAADVAEETFKAVLENHFLVILPRAARWQYRMKRVSPKHFFAAVRKAARSFVSSQA